MRIDEIVARLLPGLEERVMRPNSEVLAAVMAHGWTQKTAPRRDHREVAQPVQYELRV